MTDAEIKQRIQELEDEREELGELDEDSRDELRELRQELRSKKAQAKTEAEAQRKWQAASSVLRVTIPERKLREGVTWDTCKGEDDFVFTGAAEAIFYVLSQADFESMRVKNEWPETHGFLIETVDRQSIAGPIKADKDSLSDVLNFYTPDATQEEEE